MTTTERKEFFDKELSTVELRKAIREEIRTSSNVCSPETKQIFYGLLNLITQQQEEIETLKKELSTVKKQSNIPAESSTNSDYSILSEITFT